MTIPHDSQASDDTSKESVVQLALALFANQGFKQTKLEQVATLSGISKRMIHYHFTDKKGLYRATLALAVRQLRPTAEELEPESVVPVESVKKIVSVMFDHFQAHPDAARLIACESVYHYLDVDVPSPLPEQSDLFLQLNKLLMLGQDAGAFRPGISALDMYAAIVSMCLLPYTWNVAFTNLYNTDLLSESNAERLRIQGTDMVVSFLTAQLPETGDETYLQPGRAVAHLENDPEADPYSTEESYDSVYE